MEFVCGESAISSRTPHPEAEKIDYRFFYTSNISSVRREFMVAGGGGRGCGSTRDFTYAAFEDSELAYRLQAAGSTCGIRAEGGARAITST